MKALTHHRFFLPVYIAALFFIGFLLRWFPGADVLVFPYDQARDVLTLQQAVATRDPILIGPITDIPGIYHGPLFYYLLTPLYILSNWQPVGPLVGFIIINLLTLITLAYASERLFKNRVLTILALLFFTFSYEAVSYARWLSNPVLAIPLIPLLLLWLWQVWDKKPVPHFWLGVVIGLMTQAEILFAYVFIVAVLAYYLRGRSRQEFLRFGAGGLLAVLPYLVAEVKFKGQSLAAAQGFLQQQAVPTSSQISEFIVNWLTIWGQIFRNSLFGFTLPAAVAAGITLLISSFLLAKRLPQIKFLIAIWLSSLCLFVLGKHVAIFFMAGFMTIVILLFAFILEKLRHQYPALVVTVVALTILSQLLLIKKANANHQAYVFIQENVLLDQRLSVLRSVSERVEGEWTISVLGTPYGVRTPWSYYTWLAGERFGLTPPRWYGFAANGYVGDELLPAVDHPAQTHIVIIEPQFDIDEYSIRKFQFEQEEATELVEEWSVEGHTLQLRKPVADSR